MTTCENSLKQKYNYSSTPNLSIIGNNSTKQAQIASSKSKPNIISQFLSYIKPKNRSTILSKTQLNSINEDAVHDSSFDLRNKGGCHETESETNEINEYKANLMFKYGSKSESKPTVSRQSSFLSNYASLNNLDERLNLCKSKHSSLVTVINCFPKNKQSLRRSVKQHKPICTLYLDSLDPTPGRAASCFSEYQYLTIFLSGIFFALK
jgi:hypothetical protein